MSNQIHARTCWIAAIVLLTAAASAHGEGRLSGVVGRGLKSARNGGGAAMSRVDQMGGAARTYVRRKSGVAESGGDAARVVATYGVETGKALAKSGNAIVGTVGSQVTNAAGVATRPIDAAGAAAYPVIEIAPAAKSLGDSAASLSKGSSGLRNDAAKVSDSLARSENVTVIAPTQHQRKVFSGQGQTDDANEADIVERFAGPQADLTLDQPQRKPPAGGIGQNSGGWWPYGPKAEYMPIAIRRDGTT